MYRNNYLQATSAAERILMDVRDPLAPKSYGLGARNKSSVSDILDESEGVLDVGAVTTSYLANIKDVFGSERVAELVNASETTQNPLEATNPLFEENPLYVEDTMEMEGPNVPPRPTLRPGSIAFENLSERELLALTIEAEARGEGYEGMLAAASVMANRVGDGRYGENFKEVLLAPGQFSAWNGYTGYASGEGAVDMANLQPSELSYKVADEILSGDYVSPVGGATHYYNPAASDPKWGQARAGGDWQRLGNHLFGYAD